MKPTLLLKSLLVASLIAGVPNAFAQGTAFTYQGRLNHGANIANGSYDFRFALYDDATGGTTQGLILTKVDVPVSNGLFTVEVDFGNQFPGYSRWLELYVRTNGGGSYTLLTPRQPLTPTPYAVTAGNISGVLAASQLPTGVVTNGAVVSGSFSGNGAGVTNVNAATLGGVSGAGFWKTNGNTGANPATGAFLGTADNQPLEFKVNGQRALRLEPNTNSPNVVGGNAGNVISNEVVGGFIGGGGNSQFPNRVGGNYASVLGGFGNIAGGSNSMAMGDRSYAGGDFSTAMGKRAAAIGTFSTAIGYVTTASGLGSTALGISTVASGDTTTAMGTGTTASGAVSTAMGYATVASGDYSTAMGFQSAAGGTTSVAMGANADAAHDNTFVWSDGSAGIFTSSALNQFLIHASGGVGINTNNPNGAALSVAGTTRLSGNVNVIGNLAAGAVSSASGFAAQALGYSADASGNYSLALGYDSTASGNVSLAAGYQATAAHQGSFVWSDATGFPFASTGDNQFLIRAAGGVGIGTATPQATLQVASSATWPKAQLLLTQTANDYARFQMGVGNNAKWMFAVTTNAAPSLEFYLAASKLAELTPAGAMFAQSFNPTSDRNAKENFDPVSPQEVLEKVAGLTISRWNFIGDSATPHVGPMAQDFHAAFGLGTDDKHIATVDADGVALAAIQGLNQKVEREASLRRKLETENAELKRELAQIKEMLTKLSEPKP
ncbi:MAG: tail fiber domain-containing protein [Verrucomicrobia bacterium]|nr:tail fiber domain-containing protein [Verrucomicrobiota bacterium]